tara:strand:- start:240 stop:440 length:201 start_codon:yes stop_codon:yes gene_type:complete
MDNYEKSVKELEKLLKELQEWADSQIKNSSTAKNKATKRKIAKVYSDTNPNQLKRLVISHDLCGND